MKKPICLFVLAALSACAVGPDYAQPKADAPERFVDSDARLVQGNVDLAEWWSVFGDPTLDSLMRRAAETNLDLMAATSRVREARALLQRASGESKPTLDANSGYSRSRQSENLAPTPGGPYSDLYSAGFDARWELDVFGGTSRAVEASEADLAASEEDRRAVRVTLMGEVAAAYVDLRGAQRLGAVARSNVQSARTTLELMQSRLAARLASELDVARAQAQLAFAEAPIADFDVRARVAMHRLAVLLAQPPAELIAELQTAAPIPAVPEQVLVGLPSELLRRRPDVRRAERQLAAATARIGVAVAERYPKFSLSGAFGLESLDSSDFTDAASRAWSIGPAMRFPIFSGGRILADIEIQEARAEQALLAYRSSMLIALEDVEGAIVAYLRSWDERRALDSATAATRTSVDLSSDLYRSGLTDFRDVLDTERQLFESELELARSEADASRSVVALYKALGGGWKSEG